MLSLPLTACAAKDYQADFYLTDLKSTEDLNELLSYFQIKPDNWIKSVSDLFNEIKKGDCRLSIENGILHRHVEGVAIKCFYTNKQRRKIPAF